MALVDTGRFNKFQQFYPVRGHSFLAGDKDFCVIKRSLRKIDRNYAVHDYTETIIKSNNNINKFTVKKIASADLKLERLVAIVL